MVTNNNNQSWDTKNDRKVNPRGSNKDISGLKAVTFIASVTFLSAFAGFGLALGRVKKKNPNEFSQFQATRLAVKALGLGTVISLTGCGIIIMSVKYVLQINDVTEFGNIVRSKMPKKDGEFVKKFDSWRIPRQATDDENELKEAIS